MRQIYCEVCNVYFPLASSYRRHLPKKGHKMQFETMNSVISATTLQPIFTKKVNFDSQLSLFLKAIELNDVEVMFESVCLRLYELFSPSLEKYRIQKSGSTLTGLCFKTSCLKLHLYLDNSIATNDNNDIDDIDDDGMFLDSDDVNTKVYNKAAKLINQDRNSFGNIVPIKEKTMNLIRFFDKTMQTYCELHFVNIIEVYRSLLIKHYLSLDPRIKPLMMLIKYWARHWKLSIENSEGKMTNYALVMLTIFYLQQPDVNLAPAVMELTRNCVPQIIDGWQVNFDQNYRRHPTNNQSSIPELLYGFFKFYDDFDFDDFVICPIDGYAYLIKDIDRHNLPASMNRYREYLENTSMPRTFVSVRPMCIQDPIELNYNCSQNISANLFKSFQRKVKYAVDICTDVLNNDSSLLLFNLFQEVPEYSEHIFSESTDLVLNDENVSEELREVYYLRRLKPILEEFTSFEEQLSYFLSSIAVSDIDIFAVYDPICVKLTEIFRQFFPMAQIHRFGSTVTGIGFQKCDLDMYLNIGDPISPSECRKFSDNWTIYEVFLETKNLLTRNSDVYKNITPISEAKVPIIKFVHEPTQICCNLAFDSLGYYKSALVNHYLSFDPRIKPLLILIKFWAKRCRIAEENIQDYSKLSNYALALLVIFYLQQPNVNLVPPVSELTRQCEPEIIDGWQVNFDRGYQSHPTDNKKSVPELLFGFFKFYAHFNFEKKMVCPIDGVEFPNRRFMNMDRIPRTMHRYKEYIENTPTARAFVSIRPMCIQDPIELNNNCSQHVSASLLKLFRKHLYKALDTCAKAVNNDKCSRLLFNLFKGVADGKDVSNDENDSTASEARNKISDEFYVKNLKPIFEGRNSFNEQLTLFLNMIVISDVDTDDLYKTICEKLNQLFRQSFPMSQTHRYDSAVTEISYQNGELDIYLSLGEPIGTKDYRKIFDNWTFNEIFLEAKNILYKNSNLYRNIVPISKARVPIIKFIHEPTKINCDLSFNSFGYYNSCLVKYYVSLDPRIKRLSIVIKYWAKRSGILMDNLRKSGQLTNYALLMLIVFYLQQPNVNLIPPVIELMKNCEPEVVDGWQVNFNHNYQFHFTNNESSIPVLLLGFFEFYAYFNFEEFVISPIDGCSHRKAIFQNEINKLPESMERYKNHVASSENPHTLIVERLCIQDPIELNANCAKNVSRPVIDLIHHQAMKAAEICGKALKSNPAQMLLDLCNSTMSKRNL